jgi:hypothetical protein
LLNCTESFALRYRRAALEKFVVRYLTTNGYFLEAWMLSALRTDG